MKKIMLVLLTTVVVYSCNNPLKKEYSDETLKKDGKAIYESGKLDSLETELLAKYILMAKMTDKNLDGITYEDILKKAKELKAKREKEDAEKKALAEQAAKKEKERTDRLKNTILVTIFEKGFYEVDFESDFMFKFAMQNKSDKDIKAIKGKIIIKDIFDDKLLSITYKYDEGIKANSTSNVKYYYKYNQFDSEDNKVKNTDLKDLKIYWIPKTIIFADGSILE